jgi:hypothetical protein
MSSSQEIPVSVRTEVQGLVRVGSNWQRIKEDGYKGLNAEGIQAFERVRHFSKAVGLLINPEGELEGFCRPIPRTRKSDWLAQVLQLDIAGDPSLQDARSFAAEIREVTSQVVGNSLSRFH